MILQNTPNKEACFKFVTDAADAIIPAYIPLIAKNRDGPYGEIISFVAFVVKILFEKMFI